MNRDSMRQLHLDRRLLRRRGWIDPEELARELEALPDVADKAMTLGDASPAEDDADAPAGPPAPAAGPHPGD